VCISRYVGGFIVVRIGSTGKPESVFLKNSWTGPIRVDSILFVILRIFLTPKDIDRILSSKTNRGQKIIESDNECHILVVRTLTLSAIGRLFLFGRVIEALSSHYEGE
jgi:hypothetical protein